ncbi:hypothetical protein HJG54_07535 [Leptolyngbya sp. NK1-12]|uniref:Uncharacterized protein n=1 Tax=Leptolyngbya sp. NK1-12 TaxID=2547451 RepID=A0AA96WTJ2_9CYAN|nr:hypothetical protein [Leptolyngbya sp. NK1-12]WNZ22722.1 hypothetical protein HJG54_07535 [Leptolyngbya sp. NK1-12]
MDSRAKASHIIDTIISQAQTVWGDRYLIELVRAYCEIESTETGKAIKPVQRRSQLVRILNEKTCELTTLMRLLTSVGIELELYIRKKL